MWARLTDCKARSSTGSWPVRSESWAYQLNDDPGGSEKPIDLVGPLCKWEDTICSRLIDARSNDLNNCDHESTEQCKQFLKILLVHCLWEERVVSLGQLNSFHEPSKSSLR
jgi:hypothetical protein